MRILVIDDNADCAFLLSELIKKCGHETEVALTAEAGFSKAKEWQPNIVMLDLAMPDGNGYKLASRLRAQAGLHTARSWLSVVTTTILRVACPLASMHIC